MAKIRPDIGLRKIDIKNPRHPFSYVGVKVEMSFEEFGLVLKKIKSLFSRKNK
jgi:hypothetical protein